MMRTELRFAGFGGQGVILMGHIFGKAAVIQGKNVTLTQSYGPEARGGSCSVDLILSEEDIFYPHVRNPDILVIMSQSALDTYISGLKGNGKLLTDLGLVDTEEIDISSEGIPATEMAEKELGTRIVANMVMLGFITGKTGLVSAEMVKESIKTLVPTGTEDKNIKAFELGYKDGTK